MKYQSDIFKGCHPVSPAQCRPFALNILSLLSGGFGGIRINGDRIKMFEGEMGNDMPSLPRCFGSQRLTSGLPSRSLSARGVWRLPSGGAACVVLQIPRSASLPWHARCSVSSWTRPRNPSAKRAWRLCPSTTLRTGFGVGRTSTSRWSRSTFVKLAA